MAVTAETTTHDMKNLSLNGATGDQQAEEDNPRESIRVIDEIREKRLAKGKGLKHDIGAGSPCLKCGEGCVGGFELHFWRKRCKNCQCPPENHDIKDDSETIQKIGKLFGADHEETYGHLYVLDVVAELGVKDKAIADKFNKFAKDSGLAPGEGITFEWIPSNITKSMALKYFSSLPIENQPIKNTTGAAARTQQLQKQLPTHDVDPVACKSVGEKDLQTFMTFVENYKEQALGIGNVKEQLGNQKWTCAKCNEPCAPGSVAVFAERAGTNRCWHPKCFKCSDCDELLVDLIYFWHNGTVYCGRHYADRHRPRCKGCDELIMSGQYTQAEDANWHVNHFCCFKCDQLLGGHQYINKEGHPYCMNCYQLIFAKTCCTCLKKIDATSSRLTHGDNAWHASPECFKCCQCAKNLMSLPFISKNGVLFCSKACRKQHSAANTPV